MIYSNSLTKPLDTWHGIYNLVQSLVYIRVNDEISRPFCNEVSSNVYVVCPSRIAVDYYFHILHASISVKGCLCFYFLYHLSTL